MQFEIGNYGRGVTTEEINKTIFAATDKKIPFIAVPSNFVGYAFDLMKEFCTVVSPVDFPFGYGCTGCRLNEINELLKRGAKVVELMVNSSLVAEHKYKAIADDASAAHVLCEAKNLTLRALLDYKLFDTDTLVETAKKLYGAGIRQLTLGTSCFLDDPADNLVIAKEIGRLTKMKVIANSWFCTQAHLDMAKKNNLFGMRINSAPVATRLFQK